VGLAGTCSSIWPPGRLAPRIAGRTARRPSPRPPPPRLVAARRRVRARLPVRQPPLAEVFRPGGRGGAGLLRPLLPLRLGQRHPPLRRELGLVLALRGGLPPLLGLPVRHFARLGCSPSK
jgi:hypothetical protein